MLNSTLIFFFRFSLLPMNYIRIVLNRENYNLTKAVKSLNVSHPFVLKTKRKSFSQQVDFRLTDNIEFLKEVNLTFSKNYILTL